MLGVYVHIPFCESKCHYCAFASFVKDERTQERYMNSLIEEIETFAKKEKRKVDTIYIGGGTPSIISIPLMKKLINALKDNFVWTDDLEFTIEVNPCSITREKLEFYKGCGVNRLSVGVQSLDDEQLKVIGRRHNSREAIEKLTLAGKYFNNLSCDMLIGLPKMDKNAFLKNIEFLTSMGIKHISSYMLQIEDNTPLAKMASIKEVVLPDDDECVEAYDEMVKLLKTKGFDRYEVSNFALKGFESKHNFKYWTGEPYIGFGLGAHSYLDGVRFANSCSFEGYYARQISQKEILTDKQKIEEHIMLGLRCKAGISKSFLKSYGYQLDNNENFKLFLQNGVIFQENDKVFLNPNYYGVSNYIISSLIP